MDFGLSPDHHRLRGRCLELAADFSARSAAHDRDATHPTENYDILRREGFLALTVPREYGGQGVSFLGHTLVCARGWRGGRAPNQDPFFMGQRRLV